MLVPLDGSSLAEAALEPALALARGFDSQVVLLRVVAPAELEFSGGLYALSRVWEQQERQAARAYLETVRTRCGLPRNTHLVVEMGTAPTTIIATAVRLSVSLIVMSTHSRSGVGRLLYGSVAEAVVRATTVPVLLAPGRYQTLTLAE
ncbi:MAG: universal stress protein [Anaerolineales bacterium]|nr:universal stress protein [Anaerolineales bacterium]